MWKGVCIDEFCQQTLVFPECLAYITCQFCGQTHSTSSLLLRTPIDTTLEENQQLLKCSVDKFNHPPKGPDLIKVMGLSHYHEKLISPLLSTYGMDKHTGKAVLLRILTGRSNLDCSVFSDRSFVIDPRHIAIPGFGKDPSANEYLAETLSSLLPYNNNENNLVALHVDGDGHCLVHAISRAVMGRELFWHPLRVGLKQHFNTNLDKYKSLLGSWISNQEWGSIIEECDPTYTPPDGSMVGLRNIHVFGLANLLRRPIILIDCLQGMKASADYAAVFLPGLNPPMACRDKSGRLNPPLLLAWSSSARNHYVPVVPIKSDAHLPRVPRSFLPEVWGFPQSLMDTYIHFDDQNCFTLGFEGNLPHPYILKLTSAMDELFLIKNEVSPTLITDLYQFEFRGKVRMGDLVVGWYDRLEEVVPACVTALQEGRVVRCISCSALSLLPIRGQWLRNGGVLYQAASKMHGFLTDGTEYVFRNNLYISPCFSFKYNSDLDILVIHKFDANSVCPFCQECSLRKVKNDSTVMYENGDRTLNPVSDPSKTRCGCGAKHFWGNQYYDNPPIFLTLDLHWNGIDIRERIVWFEGESDESLNSSLYETASRIIRNNFSTPRCTASSSASSSNLILDDYDLSKLQDYIIEELIERTSSVAKQMPESNKRQHPEEHYDAPRKKHSREDFSPQPSTSST